MYLCVRVCLCAYVNVCVSLCEGVSVCVCARMCVPMRACTCVSVCVSNAAVLCCVVRSERGACSSSAFLLTDGRQAGKGYDQSQLTS